MGGSGRLVLWIVAGGLVVTTSLACSDPAATRSDGVPLPDRTERAGDASSTEATTTEDGGVEEFALDGGEAPVTACDKGRGFGPPMAVAGLDPSIVIATPRLSIDELSIYVTVHDAQGISKLAKATRTSRSSPFGAVAVLPQSSATSPDNDPAVAADGLSLWFHSRRTGNADLYMATRSSTNDAFGAAQPVPNVNTTNAEAHAYFRATGSELWFVRDTGGTTGYDVYRATKTGTTFTTPVLVKEVSSATQDWQPMVTEDGLTMLLSSDRPGGQGKMDLWIAHRKSTSAPFDPPAPVTELNTAMTEFAGWLSNDGCRVYFSSGRDTADARQQIFMAERPMLR